MQWDGDPRLLRRTVGDVASPPRHFMAPHNPQRELDWSKAAHERLAARYVVRVHVNRLLNASAEESTRVAWSGLI